MFELEHSIRDAALVHRAMAISGHKTRSVFDRYSFVKNSVVRSVMNSVREKCFSFSSLLYPFSFREFLALRPAHSFLWNAVASSLNS
jgi:hypothetical protein